MSRHAPVLIAIAGAVAEAALWCVDRHIMNAHPFASFFHDDPAQGVTIAMMAVSFATVLALAGYLFIRLKRPVMRWHWGRIAMFTGAWLVLARFAWVSLMADEGPEGPGGFLSLGVVFGLIVGAIVPLGLTWLWFGERT